MSSSTTNLNDYALPDPLLESTTNALADKLANLLTHRNALILTLHKHFKLPLLTIPSASRLLRAYSRLNRVIRVLIANCLGLTTFPISTIPQDTIASLSATLAELIRDSRLLAADIARETSTATSAADYNNVTASDCPNAQKIRPQPPSSTTTLTLGHLLRPCASLAEGAHRVKRRWRWRCDVGERMEELAARGGRLCWSVEEVVRGDENGDSDTSRRGDGGLDGY